jgi:hypothetical protein
MPEEPPFPVIDVTTWEITDEETSGAAKQPQRRPQAHQADHRGLRAQRHEWPSARDIRQGQHARSIPQCLII